MKRCMHSRQHAATFRGRRRLRVAVGLALLLSALLIGLDTVTWLRLERQLDRRLQSFAATAHTAGWRFSAHAGERGGWPLDATLTLVRPSLRSEIPLMAGGIDWSGDSLTLVLSPLHRRRATVLAHGTQTLSVASGSAGPLRLRFWGAGIALGLPVSDTGADADLLTLEAEALHVAPIAAGPDDVVGVAGLTARLHWHPDHAPAPAGTPAREAASLFVLLRDIALPVRPGQTGSRVLQRARLQAELTGILPARAQPIDQAVAFWQRGGGIRLDEASIDWNESGAALSGHAALLPDGSLDGRFSLSLTQPLQGLRQLHASGLIDAGTQLAAGAVLGLVAAAAPGPQLHLPLTLDHGTLELGTIPLARLGAVRLPATP